MLSELSIKNFALIKEANINFKDNLNIITGETGSGKSILLGSVNMCLGKRFNKDLMRNENEDTIASVVFDVDDKNILDKLQEMDVSCEDGRVIIYRKINKDKNTTKINDIPCTLNKIKEVTDLLLDVYGQHDSEDLRKNSMHLEFLDDYIGKDAELQKKAIKEKVAELKALLDEYKTFDMDESQRLREIELLTYEINELKEIDLKEGEEDELSDEYKRLSNAKNIIDSIYRAKEILSESNIGLASKELKSVLKYDDQLNPIYENLSNLESLSRDLERELEDKIDDYNVDDKKLYDVENRLNAIRKVLMKYDNSVEKALKEFEEKERSLTMLSDYEKNKNLAEEKIDNKRKELNKLCEILSQLRQTKAKEFEEKLVLELKDLGFLDVRFKVELTKKDNPTEDGYDDCVFYISLNTGEKMMPISEVASGGELSRIMLSIKTVLSNNYGKETLIFDEIDQGISGITATKVAKKLKKISRNHQVICITHLPQIACMADNHYMITKNVEDNRTLTNVYELDMDGMIKELGRLIGTNEILTDKVLANAKELKETALKDWENV